MKKDYYSTLDICKIFGFDKSKLREWINGGFIIPTVKAKKQGQAAKFTLLDLYLIDFFQLLLDRGFNRKEAGEIVTLLKGELVKAGEVGKHLAKNGKLPFQINIDSITLLFKDSDRVRMGLSFTSTIAAKKGQKRTTEKINRTTDFEKEFRDNDCDAFFAFNFKKTRERVNSLLEA